MLSSLRLVVQFWICNEVFLTCCLEVFIVRYLRDTRDKWGVVSLCSYVSVVKVAVQRSMSSPLARSCESVNGFSYCCEQS